MSKLLGEHTADVECEYCGDTHHGASDKSFSEAYTRAEAAVVRCGEGRGLFCRPRPTSKGRR